MTLVNLARELNLSKRAVDYLIAELRTEGKLSQERIFTHRRWIVSEEAKRNFGLFSKKEDTKESPASDDSEPLNP